MNRSPASVLFGALLGLALASLLVGLGTGWACQRGGLDFAVFHSAWRLVLDGRPLEIYRPGSTPDRFLYAPGFAWLLAPLGFLPLKVGLLLWCFFKAGVLGLVLQAFARRLGPAKDPLTAVGLCAWGVFLLARPVLVDFQYGQVNLIIMAACVWALLTHFDSRAAPWKDAVSWAALGAAGVAKLFPLPLLVLPWTLTRGIASHKLARERLGAIAGVALLGLLPLVSLSARGDFFALYGAWGDALLAKGLPLESHNQSFSALLSHYFTSNLTHVMSEGSTWIALGVNALSQRSFESLSLTWSLLAAGFALAWLLNGDVPKTVKDPLAWLAIAIALLILPSHLIWKPYFVMGLPLAILAVRMKPVPWPWLALIFAGVNLTSFDIIGHYWGARLESASALLVAYLCLVGLLLSRRGARG